MTDVSIVITRRFLALQHGTEDYDATVWTYDRAPAVVLQGTPTGYAPGLLRGSIDGHEASLPELDAALQAVGLTRQAIVKALGT